ncbi:MAG: hypothetical protein ABI877_12495 [Gemmatimonadaceae bacterium]
MARMSGPFEQHLREAIAVNRVRSREYADLTRGSSNWVTVPLISSEYLLLPVARWFDRRAEQHHRAGIPVLHATFVALGVLPPVAMSAPPEASAVPASEHRGAVNRQLRRAGRDREMAVVRQLVDAELARLSCDATDAMRRHALESVRRLLTIAGPLGVRAKALDQGSPEPLLRRLLRLHLWGLWWADWLDNRARPLQRRGIPILANDLPRIPAWPPDWPQPEA